MIIKGVSTGMPRCSGDDVVDVVPGTESLVYSCGDSEFDVSHLKIGPLSPFFFLVFLRVASSGVFVTSWIFSTIFSLEWLVSSRSLSSLRTAN